MEPPPLSEDLMQEIHEAFRAQDTHNLGRITGKQLGLAMRSFGYCLTEAELYDLIDEVDMDGDGDIEFLEFQQIIVKRMEALNKPENLMAIFKLFDRDENGVINATEMRNIMYSLGERCTEEEFKDLMKEVDGDNDGKITYHDFVSCIKN